MYKPIILMCLLSGPVSADWTAHLVSTHYNNNDLYNNINPGLAYTTDSYYRFGALKNSFKHLSLYAMKVVPIRSNLRFGFGAISGYERETGYKVLPAFAVEYDLNDRFSVVWFGAGINLEVKF